MWLQMGPDQMNKHEQHAAWQDNSQRSSGDALAYTFFKTLLMKAALFGLLYSSNERTSVMQCSLNSRQDF